MTNATATGAAPSEERKKLISAMAASYGFEDSVFMDAIKRRVAKEATTPDLLLFLHTASEYGLDPLATPPQIALFVPKNKDGGVPKPYVTFDGWMRVLLSHPRYYNHGWKDEVWSGGQRGKGTLDAITFWIDRFEPRHAKLPVSHACECERDVFEHTELLAECRVKGDYTPWNTWPARMLKEKGGMQGTRFCFNMYIPALDDLMSAAEMDTARAEAAENAPPAQGPITPAAPIVGAKRARGKKAAEPELPALPPPDVAGQTTIDDFLRGKSEPVPVAAAPMAAALAEAVAELPKPTDRATLPAYDPAASLAVDKAIAAAQNADDFDDILS